MAVKHFLSEIISKFEDEIKDLTGIVRGEVISAFGPGTKGVEERLSYENSIDSQISKSENARSIVAMAGITRNLVFKLVKAQLEKRIIQIYPM